MRPNHNPNRTGPTMHQQLLTWLIEAAGLAESSPEYDALFRLCLPAVEMLTLSHYKQTGDPIRADVEEVALDVPRLAFQNLKAIASNPECDDSKYFIINEIRDTI